MFETLEKIKSEFNEVMVCKKGKRIDLDVEGATYATYHPSLYLSGYSWDALSAGALLHENAQAESTTLRILVLGLGGGTVTRQLRHLLPYVHLEAVEIDAEVVRLAKRYMGLAEQNVKVHVENALFFLQETQETWDVILDDLYLTEKEDVVRSSVPEGDYLQLLCSRLTKNGILLANVITDVGHEKVQMRVRDAFAENFVEKAVVIPPRGLNEIIVGGNVLRGEDAFLLGENVFSQKIDLEYWQGLSLACL